jgi:chromosome segregation ATPase
MGDLAQYGVALGAIGTGIGALIGAGAYALRKRSDAMLAAVESASTVATAKAQTDAAQTELVGGMLDELSKRLDDMSHRLDDCERKHNESVSRERECLARVAQLSTRLAALEKRITPPRMPAANGELR